jgi:hypothetical protein
MLVSRPGARWGERAARLDEHQQLLDAFDVEHLDRDDIADVDVVVAEDVVIRLSLCCSADRVVGRRGILRCAPVSIELGLGPPSGAIAPASNQRCSSSGIR